jgi:hypothetical protein
MTELHGVSNGAQRSENERKNSFLNYKSAALSGDATWPGRIRLFTFRRSGMVALALMPRTASSWFITFGPICKDLTARRVDALLRSP